jgi:glycosyltransferase involved in cell wall biosynthesis
MKTVLIGIDGNEANVSQRVGSNGYAWELLRALHEYLSETHRFAVRVYLAQPPLPDMPAATDWWQYRVLPPPKLWTQWRLPLDLWQHRDFSPGHYLPSTCPVPTVATIMDLGYERFPEQFRTNDLWQLRLLTRFSVRQARHLFAISEFTKRDLHELYQQPLSKITVAYPAVANISQPTADISLSKQNWGINQPYFLYVGTLQPRKNIIRLIAAYDQLRQSGHAAQLVLAGKVGWLSEGMMAARDASAYAADIVLTGYVSEEEKTALMRDALATVLVGLYEGFGIPPLESIQLGTLPIVSSTASLPEVVGPDYPWQVDPYNVPAIAAALTKVITATAEEKSGWLQLAQKHARQFSWHNTARLIGETLARLAEPATLVL